MNKKDRILSEAKRLFGQYGYMGFTLKQLAVACDMTAPALYYFYSSKADLFKDCLMSEMEIRHELQLRCAEQAKTMDEFAIMYAAEALQVCNASGFRVVHAMEEIVHLPAEMQAELTEARIRLLVKPFEDFFVRIWPDSHSVSPRLAALFFTNLASFAALHMDEYSREELAQLFAVAAAGFMSGNTAQRV